MIRPATEFDAEAIAEIHIRAWQAAYQGILPPEYLSQLSVEQRTHFWRRELLDKRSIVLVSEQHGKVTGWPT